MAKRGAKGGRATPKGTGSTTSGRYTPPIPREQKVSPAWVPAVMFTCLGLGMAIIVANYLGLLPGHAKNAYLLVGLGLITAGFITATQFH
jgi:Cell division protein CrgA